ncbi:MAG: ComE operon protein 1 [Planctomycetota bacterium]|jgi:competence ComEA-like helix-hairpin-helix protein
MNSGQSTRSAFLSPTRGSAPAENGTLSSSATSDGTKKHERGRLQRWTAGQLLNGLMLALVAVLLVEWFWVVTRRPQPFLIQRGSDFQNTFRLEINSATWVEWMQLQGIGPSMANRIVADRQVNGPFASIEDLARVPGIGSGTLDRIRPSLTIRHEQKTAQRSNP